MLFDNIADRFVEVANSGTLSDVRKFLDLLEIEIKNYPEGSSENQKLKEYISKLKELTQEAPRMADYLSQAKEGIAKRDWGFVLFCLTRHLSLPDPKGESFDKALDILRKLVEPQVMSEAGKEKIIDFLHKIPIQFQGKSEYKELMGSVQGGAESRPAGDIDSIRNELHGGNTELIAMVDDGLALMYSYAFDKAISKFEQVLKIDPNYESARQYLQDAKEYKSGKARPPRLTQDVTLPLGRAMSMIRASQFASAQDQLELVYKALGDKGIQEWQELTDVFQEVTDGVNAEKQYAEAKELFKKGDIDGARDKAQQAFKLLNKPLYQELVQKAEEFEAEISRIQLGITSGGAVDDQINLLLEAESKVKSLIVRYPDNELLQKLTKEIDKKKPIIKGGLQRRAEGLLDRIDQDRYSSELGNAISLAKQATQAVTSAENAGALGQDFDQVRANAQNKLSQLEGLERRLSEAENILNDESLWIWTRWQKAASSLMPVARQYPRDTRVQKLKADLRTRESIIQFGKLISVLLGIVLTGICLFGSFTSIRNNILALTPSSTPLPPTMTFTPLPTTTGTATITPLPSSTPTFTPSPTSTPVYYLVPKELFARIGCYDAFKSSGRIPAGAKVFPDWSSETKDPFSRTCLFVRYQQDTGETISGYVLLSDLAVP